MHGEKVENIIGVMVPGVRFDRKRLPTLLGAIWAHSGLILGNFCAQRCPSERAKCGYSKIL